MTNLAVNKLLASRLPRRGAGSFSRTAASSLIHMEDNVMKKTILVIAGAALIGAPAFADLLVDTSTGAGGTNFLSLLGNLDDGFVVRPLGNTYTFYGVGYSSMAMEANGNITPTGSGSFSDVAFPTAAPPRIAPQWD